MKKVSHAEQIAKTICNWLKERKFNKTLLAVAGDSQKVNTGVRRCAKRKIEIYLQKKSCMVSLSTSY